jgi:hypothetical protein
MKSLGPRAVAELLRGAWRVEPTAPEIDTARLASLLPALRRGGVAGLAWNRVRLSALADSEPGFELRQQFRHQALQRAVHEQALLEAQRRLEAAGEQAFLAKGWVASRLYPAPGLRPCGDIDLYVGIESHARAFAALASGGRPLPVDLHRGLADLSDRPGDAVWERTRLVQHDQLRVRVPGAEDHLRLLSLHMLRHGVSRPMWLCDVAVALEARPADFDWDWFRAGSPQRTEAALLGLRLAGELLGARLDGVPVIELPSWVAPAVFSAWEAGVHRREPFLNQVRTSPGRALREHWPSPIEATVGVGARFDQRSRLPYQLAHLVARALRRTRTGVARRRPAPPARRVRLAEARGR